MRQLFFYTSLVTFCNDASNWDELVNIRLALRLHSISLLFGFNTHTGLHFSSWTRQPLCTEVSWQTPTKNNHRNTGSVTFTIMMVILAFYNLRRQINKKNYLITDTTVSIIRKTLFFILKLHIFCNIYSFHDFPPSIHYHRLTTGQWNTKAVHLYFGLFV